MKSLFHKLRQLVASVLFVLPLTACAATPTSPLEGQVLEAEGRAPIPNALVVGLWYGTSAPGFFVDSTTVCYHVANTTTDQNGRYTLPPTEKQRKYQDGHHYTTVWAYRRGYEDARRREGNTVLLQPFTGGREERFQSLWRIVGATGCQTAGHSSRNLYPLYKAIYEESKPLAVTEEEKQKLQLMREIAATAWIAEGRQMTTREAQKLIEEYLRDHLQ